MAQGSLTDQTALLRYVHGYQLAKGYSPSFQEMAEALGVQSKGTVTRLLGHLEARGRIRRLPFRQRAIEILDIPSIPRAPDDAPLFSVPLQEPV